MRMIVTAGPTREHIDTVRFITNASSGRMGCAVAVAAARAGHEVTLLAGPVCQDGMRDTGDLAYSFRAVDMLVCQVVARRGDW